MLAFETNNETQPRWADPGETGQRGARRVLMADDQADILSTLQLLLKADGYEIEAVTEPKAVLRAITGREFDLVLVDLNYTRDTTSGREGLELVSQIRELDKSVPVVVMTAWGNIHLAVEAMQRGASDFIEKPWNNRELLTKISSLMERNSALRRERRRQEYEIDEARRIQGTLLPRQIPGIPGYDLAAATRPVSFVGGDYYNAAALDERHTALCVGDVSGKGLSAAMMMSGLHAAIKPLITPATEPGELCRLANQLMCEVIPEGKFVSFFYAILNRAKNRLRYSNAGHNPPLLLRADGTVIELRTEDAVLGHFRGWEYRNHEIDLQPGDTVLLFTDGVVEACNADGEPYGEERLVGMAAEYRVLSAERLREVIMQAVSEYCGGTLQDDATLLVIKRN